MPFLESKFPNPDDNELSKGLSIDKIESLIKLTLIASHTKKVLSVNFSSKIFIKGIFVCRPVVSRKLWFVSFSFSCLHL